MNSTSLWLLIVIKPKQQGDSFKCKWNLYNNIERLKKKNHERIIYKFFENLIFFFT